MANILREGSIRENDQILTVNEELVHGQLHALNLLNGCDKEIDLVLARELTDTDHSQVETMVYFR